MHDVAIIGGSLAGACCALHLARAGINVVIVERKAFPRRKACGQGLLPSGVQELNKLGLSSLLTTIDASHFYGVDYHAYGQYAQGRFRGEVGRGVLRERFDTELQRHALGAGATLRHANMTALHTGRNHVSIQLDDGTTVESRFVIGADGSKSRTREQLGLGTPAARNGRYALVQHFKGPDLDAVQVHVFAGFELYLTPLGKGTVGVAALLARDTLRKLSGNKSARLAALLARASGVQLGEATTEAMGAGPLRVKSRDVVHTRGLLVGDAAGYVDAITGEGMSLALTSARFAADALAAALGGDSAAFRTYRRRRLAIFREHALLTNGLVVVASHPRLCKRVVARLAKEPQLFSALLEVGHGARTLASLGLPQLLRLGIGARPTR